MVCLLLLYYEIEELKLKLGKQVQLFFFFHSTKGLIDSHFNTMMCDAGMLGSLLLLLKRQ